MGGGEGFGLVSSFIFSAWAAAVRLRCVGDMIQEKLVDDVLLRCKESFRCCLSLESCLCLVERDDTYMTHDTRYFRIGAVFDGL
jgi:hypothetical protein